MRARRSLGRDEAGFWLASIGFVLGMVVIGGASLWSRTSQPPFDHIQARFDSAQSCYEHDELDRARELFEGILKLEPGHLASKKYLGQILVRQKNPYEGIRFLLEYLKEKPSDAEALAWTGRGYLAEKTPAVAVTYFEQACAADPKSVPLRKETARLLMRLGEPQQAVSLIQEAIRLEPKDPELDEMLRETLAAYRPERESGRGAQSLAPGGPTLPSPLAEIEASRRTKR